MEDRGKQPDIALTEEHNGLPRLYKKKLMEINHHIKCLPEFFKDLGPSRKNFEVRKNDRNYQKGDRLTIRHYDPKQNFNRIKDVECIITYVLTHDQFEGVAKGYVVLGLDFKNTAIQAFELDQKDFEREEKQV